MDNLLNGKTIAITGVTGFLGTAIVEKILRAAPEAKLIVFVRPGKRLSAENRFVREVLRNNCFDLLRQNYQQGFEAEVLSRIAVMPGDVSKDNLGLSEGEIEELKHVDIFIHSAASVSFESPIDTAMETNLLGPLNVLNLVKKLQAVKPPQSGKIHLINLSTAYVAASHRGFSHETLIQNRPLAIDVEWQKELHFALNLRQELEYESKREEILKNLLNVAKMELGSAGKTLLARKVEELREKWITDKLVSAGKIRANTLGWPDIYSFSKSLAEAAVSENKGDQPVSILRPSIIESAMSEPFPGWIRGFRMAEPIIISYARGLLSEFPGIPEGVIDFIPVDIVVNAIVALADHGYDPELQIVQVASGHENPLTYSDLVKYAREWFLEHPVYDEHGQPIVVPEWSFPGRNRVEKQLKRAVKGFGFLERSVSGIPIRGRFAKRLNELDQKKSDFERALSYVTIYGAYSEAEAIFRTDNLKKLRHYYSKSESLNLNPKSINWRDYFQKIHLPSVIKEARLKTTPTKSTTKDRAERLRSYVLAPDRQLAVFDLENTIIPANVVVSYAYLAAFNLKPRDKFLHALRLLTEGPYLYLLDKKDRGDFLRYFYKRYQGASKQDLQQRSHALATDYLLKKAFPEAIRRIRMHKSLGHRVVLITGALDFIIEPFAPLFDYVLSAHLREDDGYLTGNVTSSPPVGELRAQMILDFAEENNFALSETVLYADAISDLPLFELVGYPVAVNPEIKLMRLASKRGWLIENFLKPSTTVLLPIPKVTSELSDSRFARVGRSLFDTTKYVVDWLKKESK